MLVYLALNHLLQNIHLIVNILAYVLIVAEV